MSRWRKCDLTITLSTCEPDRDCPLCPRLAAFRGAARAREPTWFNAPVPSWGDGTSSRLLIVGLAPGLRGANRTGRPFTGDYAGDLLYSTLIAHGFASGIFAARVDDGLRLHNTRITNAVRCVPPQNKPLPVEITNCRPFLQATIAEMADLRAIVALGRVAHESVLRAFGLRLADFPFGHGREHAMDNKGLNNKGLDNKGLQLFDSYHCSRYNTNTGVLTAEMFNDVFARVRISLSANSH